MAKKGQKFEKYTAELKAKILQKYLEGESGGRPKGSEIDYKERYEILKKFQAFVEAQRKRK